MVKARRRLLLASLALSAGLAGCTVGVCFATETGWALLSNPQKVSIYLYRESRSAFAGLMPAADRPIIRVNGERLGPLGWGEFRQMFVSPGEFSVVTEGEEGAGWAFGRFGVEYKGAAGSVRFIRLEIVEKSPEMSETTIRRNWIAGFRDIPPEEMVNAFPAYTR